MAGLEDGQRLVVKHDSRGHPGLHRELDQVVPDQVQVALLYHAALFSLRPHGELLGLDRQGEHLGVRFLLDVVGAGLDVAGLILARKSGEPEFEWRFPHRACPRS